MNLKACIHYADQRTTAKRINRQTRRIAKRNVKKLSTIHRMAFTHKHKARGYS